MNKLLARLVAFVNLVPASLLLGFFIIAVLELRGYLVLAIFMIPLILMLVVCILVVVNIVGAANSIGRPQCLDFRAVMAFKLSLVPFYVANFVCWFISSSVFHLAIIALPMIPFIIAYTYFTMIGTSIHNITKLVALRRSEIITQKQFLIHLVLQITFVLDVIDSIYLAKRQEKFESALEQQL